MAIDPARPIETSQFVQDRKRFFPQRITIGHHQLRHLISCPQAGYIYLVNKREIFRFDTITNKKTKVTDLPFEARCTATGFGYFCAGAEENGYFGAMHINEGVSDRGLSDQDEAARREELAYWESHYGITPPRLRVERLGSQIVNSISIHRLRLDTPDKASEVVALLTNNDRSVRMWSLTRDAEIEIEPEKFAFPMNHATISPNGQLLIVVGDEEASFIYRRVDLERPAANGARFEWRKIRCLRLHTPEGKDHAEYFTTAWSPNGSLLAAGSQEGFISVYDVNRIRDNPYDDTPLVVIPSSRPLVVPGPGAGPGAVRTMCFAPEPWDLLLWSEANGRIGISDVRSGLLRRQIVRLDPNDSTVSTCNLAEAPLSSLHPGFNVDFLHETSFQEDLIRLSRAQADRDSMAQTELTRDVAAMMATQHRQGGRGQGDGLTEEEWQRLDMLRTARQRSEMLSRRGARSAIPGSRQPPQRSSRPGSYGRLAPVGRDTEDNNLETTLARTDALFDAIRANMRTSPPDATEQQPWQSPDASSRASSSTAVTLHEPSDPRSDREGREEQPVTLRGGAVTRAALAQSLAQGRTTPGTVRNRALFGGNGQYPTSDVAQVLPLPRRTGLRVAEDLLAMDTPWPSTIEHGLGTTGVVWDEGRRVVYAGTEEGIFELKMNFDERKVHPAMQMR